MAAQADLSPDWAHMSETTLSQVVAQLFVTGAAQLEQGTY